MLTHSAAQATRWWCWEQRRRPWCCYQQGSLGSSGQVQRAPCNHAPGKSRRLLGRNTPTVRRAFENYDLTFLVHAGAERRLALIDLWLQEIGLSTDAVMAARLGRR